jgi:organic radical activating enzyme
METINRIASYTAANQMPAKILRDDALVESVVGGYIPPIHAQIIPTNRCNLNCGFCSCKNRDKGMEIEPNRLMLALYRLRDLGCKSVTITGGGEPLLYHALPEIVKTCRELDIETGLVTNGVALEHCQLSILQGLRWCRISCSDEADRRGQFGAGISRVDPGTVDWSLSYVVSANPNLDRIADYIDFANGHNMTHIRIVTDLLDTAGAPSMENLKAAIRARGVDDSRVIYQGRKAYHHGCSDCRIALLKPVIGPDGLLYPCCGVQYARESMDLDLPDDMIFGSVEEIMEMWVGQQPFDGSRCVRCYYGAYNDCLRLMSTPVDHEAFV